MGNTIYKPSPNSAVRTVQLRLLQKELNDTIGYIVIVRVVPVRVTDVRFHKKSNELFLLVNDDDPDALDHSGVSSIWFHEFFTSRTEAEECAVLKKISGSET